MPIDFAACVNCGRPIFYDWSGPRHVKQTHNVDPRADYSRPECDRPRSEAEAEAEESSWQEPQTEKRQ